MKTRQILDTIANEYNQYSRARGYYKAVNDSEARSKCEYGLAVLVGLLEKLGIENKTVIVEDKVNETSFTWYKMTM